MDFFANLEDIKTIEFEMAWNERPVARSIYEQLSHTQKRYGARPAISYQLLSEPTAAKNTLSWSELHAQVTQAANLFRKLGIGEKDVVAFVMPNCLETAVTLLGGMVAGIVNPINPLLEPKQIAAILNETKAKVVVTLKAFPKTDVPQKVAEALRDAPNVHTVLEVDLNAYLTGLKRFIVPLVRPKNPTSHKAQVLNFTHELAQQDSSKLNFEDILYDRVGAYFHTGGTTGMPKVAQHLISGMQYNGWLGAQLLFTEKDCVMCPLPLFHVFAVYPVMMSLISSGGHVVFPTPAGYRGEGVFDNLWKLIERYHSTYLITVPTALSALMQRPIDADISSLKNAFSGSAALPIELYRRFKEETGIEIVEGYGLTECTCLVSCNPPGGTKKIGSVGLPFPYTDVRILKHTADGHHKCKTDEIGEICISNPGVYPDRTYTEADKNNGLFVDSTYLRTGDLGRIDADGYLYITGRAKDLIIRGGHNIDPAIIEEALMSHPAVAFVGAIGEPDAHSGELPCAYVELIAGVNISSDELLMFASDNIAERAALPKYIEILPELPKTAVGKVFKPELRKMAITRVLNHKLQEAGIPTKVINVVEEKKRGLVVHLENNSEISDEQLQRFMDSYTLAWEKG